MTKVPRITAKELISVLEKMGFKQIRQTGSHRIFRNEHGVRATVPDHPGKIIHPKIIKTILQDTDLQLEDFIKLI
ncbi:MAG: hypothetical protein A2W80_13365 [Candidatus Riflebacteria bacterium GWC2_50_8]|nr:MAG: hypothetical protein A2W80_13365 [Candidatus Riflebacteria bacterium GWC2_50_8]